MTPVTPVTSVCRFEYDRVFAPGSRQEEVFEAVQPLCVSVLDGFNVCIFACEYVDRSLVAILT